MGGQVSKTCSEDKENNKLTKAGTYTRAFLRKTWAGTGREGYRFSVEYSPNSRANCKECSLSVNVGHVRMCRKSANPFDKHDGATDMKQYFHTQCLVKAMKRARCTSKVPGANIPGLELLKPLDKDRVKVAMQKLASHHKSACSTSAKSKSAAPKKKKSKSRVGK